MKWTAEDRDAIIQAFDVDGLSAALVAERFRTSRSAILGLLHRHRRAKGLEAARRKPAQARQPAQTRSGTRPRPSPPAAPVQEARAVASRPPRAVPMADLRRNECRFAVTPHDQPADAHLFCGLPATGSWCDRHAQLVYARS